MCINNLMFYIQATLCVIWFIFCAVTALVIGIVRWRNPSGGYVFTWLFTKIATKILGMRIQINGAHRLLESQPCVYIGNHQSSIDMIFQAHCYRPKTVCVGKKELLWIPFFGILFYVTGNILIHRKHHEKAMEGMNTARDFLTDKKISVYMFPEGTRNKAGGALLPFKKGAFYLALAAQVPLLPVVCCPVTAFIDLKKRKIRHGTVKIDVLEPISTVGLAESDADALIEKAYSQMQAAYHRLTVEVSPIDLKN